MEIQSCDLQRAVTKEEFQERKKVLVVDDSMTIQKFFKKALEHEGYKVYIAGTGIEALELFDIETPDIVILDVIMPDIDGIRLLSMMKKLNPDVPVIMSTKYEYLLKNRHSDNLTTLMPNSCLVKSSDINNLKNTIKQFLNKS